MGLLDVLNSEQGRLGLGLLAAGGARSDGANFGQRMQEGIGSVDQWKAQQQVAQQRQMQIDEAKLQQEDAIAMREMAARFQTPAQPGRPAIAAAPEFGIPTALGAVEAKPAGYDFQGYAQALASKNPQAALSLQQLLAKPTSKFSTAPQYDQNGRAFVMAENGEVKYLPGILARDKLNEVRLGDKVGFRTDYSPEIKGSLPIGQSPDSKASNAIGWANNAATLRGQDMTHAAAMDRLKLDRANGSEKPLTESQGASVNFGSRALTANEQLVKLEDKGSGKPGSIKRFMTAITPGLGMGLDESMATNMNWTQSDNQQLSEQAQKNFITAVLRKESGASISPSEFATAAQIYFPQPNDGAAVKAQKRIARESAIEGLRMQAGPGAKNVKSMNPQDDGYPPEIADLLRKHGG